MSTHTPAPRVAECVGHNTNRLCSCLVCLLMHPSGVQQLVGRLIVRGSAAWLKVGEQTALECGLVCWLPLQPGSWRSPLCHSIDQTASTCIHSCLRSKSPQPAVHFEVFYATHTSLLLQLPTTHTTSCVLLRPVRLFSLCQHACAWLCVPVLSSECGKGWTKWGWAALQCDCVKILETCLH